MAQAPIEGSEDRYPEWSELRAQYLEGRLARIEGSANPYKDQPHTARQSEAWIAGWLDEDAWALDSTGR